MQWYKSEAGYIILKVAGIYLLWYIIYQFFLLPNGSLDQWVNINIVSVSAGILEILGYDFYAAGRLIGIGESAGVYLDDGCSGISAIGLFVGFVIAYPGTWIPRIAYIIIGIGIIYLANIIRIIVFAITHVQAREMITVTSDYSTAIIFYLLILALGTVWAAYAGNPHVTGATR
jgi:exosortase/archaeosortase family protein